MHHIKYLSQLIYNNAAATCTVQCLKIKKSYKNIKKIGLKYKIEKFSFIQIYIHLKITF